MYSWDRAVAALPPPERQRSQRACTLRRGRAGLEVAKTGIVSSHDLPKTAKTGIDWPSTPSSPELMLGPALHRIIQTPATAVVRVSCGNRQKCGGPASAREEMPRAQ